MGDFAIKSVNHSAQQQSQFETRLLKTSNKSYSVTHFGDTAAESFNASRKIGSINYSNKSQTSARINAIAMSSSQKTEVTNTFKSTLEQTEHSSRSIGKAEHSPMAVFGNSASEASSRTKINAADKNELLSALNGSAFKNFQVEIEKTIQKSPHLKEGMRQDFEELKATVKQITTQLETSTEKNAENTSQKKKVNVGDLFFRFFKLWERIIGQADADAYALYKTTKERTDQCDRLNYLYSKLQATNGKVDWSKDEEMKKLVEEAKSLGVVIPDHKGTYQWNEEQKKNFIDNIRTKKDSLEKLSQMDKTDLQRYMQISTNGHEWRSNLLKLYERVASTLAHNIKPG